MCIVSTLKITNLVQTSNFVYKETHLMWFGPGVQVVAHVPVAGPNKMKNIFNWSSQFSHTKLTKLILLIS